MKKNSCLMVLLVTLMVFINSFAYGSSDKKTIIIVLDELDFQLAEEIGKDSFSMGLMNTKVRGINNAESYFMTIATGRKVKIKDGEFEGLIKRNNRSIEIKGYDNIIRDLNKKYPEFTNKIDFFGEKLKDKGIAFIGEDSSSLIACDKNGLIKNGETKVVYDERWLKEKTNEHLRNSNILVLSYELEGNKDRLEVLKGYLESLDEYDILIFPREVPANMKKIVNNSLVPIMYNKLKAKSGILTSDSTKRKGIITNLDILPEIMHSYGIKSHVVIGKKFKVLPSKDTIKEIKIIYNEVINMTWITYIFHGIVYFIQVYFTYFFVKNRRDKYWDIAFYYNFIIITIFISLLMGFLNIHRSVFAYLITCIMLSYSISYIITNRKLNGAGIFSTLTYIVLTLGMLFYPDFIYNSYIGYDNLIAGSRYYGFNNGAMGILLATSIISYFTIKKYLPNDTMEKILAILYFVLNIIVLSASYGANTGGFFTSIVLFLMMIYVVFLDKNFTFKNLIFLLLLGVLILFVNLYIDLNSLDKSHAGSLIYRAKILGKKEVYDIAKVKLKELLIYTLSPPWCIVLFSQILFIKSFWDKCKTKLPYILEERPEIRKEYIVLLITSIVAFIVNDTGVIAFIYMIQYLLVLFVNISIIREV
ncbi:hypothetical protein [Sporanaerobacter acetigenes]|uniref:hypothetical protein n=1 Tax=Sporanaerobacter acetigenes TaxID=165813 RepID=UPI0010521713|nr:hypothetical protein [Sporanaerobacter acetigenes]